MNTICSHCFTEFFADSKHCGQFVHCLGCKTPVRVPYPQNSFYSKPSEIINEPQKDHGYTTCSCKSCGNRIEFPSHGVGEEIDCPHCGKKTTLFVPRKRTKTDNRKTSLTRKPPILRQMDAVSEFSWKYYKHGICPKCAATFECMGGGDDLIFWDCETCGTRVELRADKLPKELPEERSRCGKCKQYVPLSANSCPYCRAKFQPSVCKYCGCTEFDIVTPSKPVLFAPLSLSGIFISAAASVIGDAIFRDEYRCARCGRKPH